MKKILYFLLLVTIAGCKKEYEGLYDKDFVTFQTKIDYCSLNYEYEAKFGGMTYKLVKNDALASEHPGIAKSMLDAKGYVSGELEITPIYMGVRQATVKFNVTLKADTVLHFCQAVGDQLRMITGPADEERYTMISFQQQTDWSKYFAPAITFNGELLQPFSTIYIPKDKRTGTLRFYQRQGNNLYRPGGKFDTSIQQPETVMKDYTFSENEVLMLAKPVGSPMVIWKDEIADQYTTLNARIVYGSASGINWLFTYKGDWMSNNYDNFVLKNNLSDTLRLYKLTRNDQDTTFIRTITGPFREGQTVDFIVNGEDMVPNTYTGAEPASRSHAFFKMGYKRAEQGTVTIPSVNVKVYLAQMDPITWSISKVRLLREMTINNPTTNGTVVYADPFETNVMDVNPPGMPAPTEDMVMGALPQYIIEVSDATTGAALTQRTLDVIPYLKLETPSMPVWPLALSYKLLHFIVEGSNGDISIAYGSGAW